MNHAPPSISAFQALRLCGGERVEESSPARHGPFPASLSLDTTLQAWGQWGVGGGQSLDTTLQAWRQWGAGPGKAVCRWDPLSVWVFLLT